jgi:putative ABC transport system permease protein
MKLIDIVKFSLVNLSQRGLRSWLTIVGIVIGVAAVFSILSLGVGMKQTISNQLGSLGGDVVYVLPGSERTVKIFPGRTTLAELRSLRLAGATIFTDKDLNAVKLTPGVLAVNGVVSGRVNLKYGIETFSIQAYGVDPVAFKEISAVKIEEGRELAPGDTNVIVIGNRVANEIFKNKLKVNSQVTINGKVFRVVGILEKVGGFAGSVTYDNAVFMPVSIARAVLTNIGSNQFSEIQFKVKDLSRLEEVVKEVEKRLMISRHVSEDTKDFTVITAKSIQETIFNVLNTLNIFLGGIAAVSLFVGAIGIANTMYMSVLERTRQIGTLKALGATNLEIMKMFLVESSLIGLVGGLIGIFLGFIASGIISEIGIRFIGMGADNTSIVIITPELILFSLAFSVFIGVVSGLMPARKAAQLQPVEALRYE